MIEAMTEAELYAPVEWRDCSAGYEDILYHKSDDGIAKITINRPQVRNAFRPRTVKEMLQALADARYDDQVGTIILTGFGEKAFCAGGDQKIRGDYGGYRDDEGTHHLNGSTSSATSAPVRNPWLPWWPATQSVAATCCT